jgi:hypothetical protein
VIKRIGLEELVGALVYIAAGGYVMFESSHYRMGTLHQMGPGYFPFLLGALLSLLGVIFIIEQALLAKSRARAESEPFDWRPLVMIALAVVLFAFLFERAGLVPSIFVLIGVGSLAQRKFSLVQALFVAFGLSLGSYLLFVRFLAIPFDLFWWG